MTDTGYGMSAQDVACAGEALFTTKPHDHGAGLGLTSVAMTMARSGGFFDLQSTPDLGTKVSMYFPCVPAPYPAGQPDSETIRDLPSGDGKTVLVVEYDPLVRDATLDRVEALGYVGLEAGDVPQALEVLREQGPVDLMFFDVVLPGEQSGYDLIAQVAQEFPRTALVLTSGHISPRNNRTLPLDADVPLLQELDSLRTLAVTLADALRNDHETGMTSAAKT